MAAEEGWVPGFALCAAWGVLAYAGDSAAVFAFDCEGAGRRFSFCEGAASSDHAKHRCECAPGCQSGQARCQRAGDRGRLLPSEYARPDQELERSEQKQRLLRATSQLPDRQRTAFLRLCEGVPIEAIATELQCSAPAVQMLIQRAKSQLQSVWSDEVEALLDDGR